MKRESVRTRFHYGFYAAMEVEYDLANIPLIYEQEIELGKDPLRLDFLIIKKEDSIVLRDPIGEFFKQVNIFEGNLSIPVQLVVSSQLPPGEYEGLKLLAHGATVEDVIKYAEKAIASDNERIKENAGTVIDICLAVNKNLEEAEKMYEGFKEFFKESIEKERQEWRKEGRREGTDRANERVAVDMLKDKYPLTAITKISKLSENVIRNLAASRGLVIS